MTKRNAQIEREEVMATGRVGMTTHDGTRGRGNSWDPHELCAMGHTAQFFVMERPFEVPPPAELLVRWMREERAGLRLSDRTRRKPSQNCTERASGMRKTS